MSDVVRLPSESPRRVLISGAAGLLGRRIVAERQLAGDVVVSLTRAGDPDNPQWRVNDTPLTAKNGSGFDIVIHLAGEPVAGARWTVAKKRRIFGSRVDGTASLVAALVSAERPPESFVCASGINVYGDRGDSMLDETEPVGKGFLATVCSAWEQAAAPLQSVSRIVSLRIGMVLTGGGGALATMLPIFRLGLGGPLGDGSAYVSWVTLNDVVRAVGHVISSKHLHGPVNLVSPEPVTNRVFTKALGRALGRPAHLPVPSWALRLAFGEFAEETVLSSVRAVPARLHADGFRFQDASIDAALATCHLRSS